MTSIDPQAVALREGIGLFHRELYFEAHEVWEMAWMRCDRGERFFWQGLIHTAAAFHHARAQNNSGFHRQRQKAMMKLAGYLPVYWSIRTWQLWSDLQTASPDSLVRIETVTIGE
jgi:hypothetical protein